jgi:Leucine-rich repeat (LRR) protein
MKRLNCLCTAVLIHQAIAATPTDNPGRGPNSAGRAGLLTARMAVNAAGLPDASPQLRVARPSGASSNPRTPREGTQTGSNSTALRAWLACWTLGASLRSDFAITERVLTAPWWSRTERSLLLAGHCANHPLHEGSDDSALAVLQRLDPSLANGPKTIEGVQVLDLSRANVTDADFAAIARATNVRYLDMGGASVSALSLRALADLEFVTRLHLERTKINDKELSRFKCLGGLKALRLGGSLVGRDGCPWLTRCNNLRHLNLSNTQVNDVELETLAKCRELRSIDLDNTRVVGTFLRQTEGLTMLEELSLRENRSLAGSEVGRLGKHKRLAVLWLSGTPTGDAEVAHISRMPRLTTLCLDRTAVTDKGMDAICENKTITLLYLRGTRITDKSLPKLGQMPALRILDLTGTGVSSTAVNELAKKNRLVEVFRDPTPPPDA